MEVLGWIGFWCVGTIFGIIVGYAAGKGNRILTQGLATTRLLKQGPYRTHDEFVRLLPSAPSPAMPRPYKLYPISAPVRCPRCTAQQTPKVQDHCPGGCEFSNEPHYHSQCLLCMAAWLERTPDSVEKPDYSIPATE